MVQETVFPRLGVWRLLALLSAAALPVGCIAPAAPNSFVGLWSTPDRAQIAFRDDTIVVHPSGMPATPMSAQACDGKFRFAYAHMSRDALLGLTPQQPDLRLKLQGMLARLDYPVAQMTCGAGESTYVMVDGSDLVVIHRDGDVAGVERLTRL
jgi:hypothetical protein